MKIEIEEKEIISPIFVNKTGDDITIRHIEIMPREEDGNLHKWDNLATPDKNGVATNIVEAIIKNLLPDGIQKDTNANKEDFIRAIASKLREEMIEED